MRELDWFDGPEDPTETRRRRPRGFPLLVAAPWLVVVGLLVAPQLGRDGAEVDPASTVAGAAREGAAVGILDSDDDVPEPATTGTSELLEPAQVLEVQELRGRWRVTPGSEEAASLAVVVARAWLTGVGPPLAIAGVTPDGGAYAEHLVVEATERTSPETEVVTVLAVVLRELADPGTTVTVERLAVPIVWDDDGPRPGGAPWPLPGPRLEPAVPTLLPMEDDGPAWEKATVALARAGLGTHQLEALQQAPDGPLVATVTDGTERHDVWLRPHVDGYVVAGSTLTGAAPADPVAEDRP